MAVRIQPSSQDTQWIIVSVDPKDGASGVVAVSRESLASIVEDDPRSPDLILDLLCQRALKRMPVPNASDGVRIITPYNLSLVWPK